LLFGFSVFNRKTAVAEGSKTERVFSYVSTAVPLFYFHATTTNSHLFLAAALLSIFGFLISTLAVIELGDRIGIAAAKRGDICQTGVYQYMKHPMYIGYIISEFGNILLNPFNLLIFTLSIAGYGLRAWRENNVLAKQV